MRRSSFTPSLFIAAAVLGLIVGPLACAQAVRVTGDDNNGDGGNGGEGGQGGGADAGSDAPPGPCIFATDCAALSDACNVGTCINGVCQKMPANDFAACDDGQYCTENDTCQAGQCVGGQQKFCPSGTEACMIGTCDEDTDSCGLGPGNDGAPCVDQDPCTNTGTCSNGVCVGGSPVNCSFLDDVCGIGTCDSQLGCIKTPKAEGSPCDDGLFCTINDSCNGGTCSGVANTCAAPGDVCLIGSCNEAQNMCTVVPGNNGGGCDDNNACTTGEKCNNGTCGGGAPANNGAACNDNNACTTGDSCSNGACAGAQIVACQNGDGCCAPGCNFNNDDDCKLIDVAVIDGGFYTDGVRSYLAAQPFIQSAVKINDCSLQTLSQYDVVVLHGNMNCFDANAFNTYVQNGGGIIGTPWIYGNNGGLASLPVSGSSITTNYMVPLNVQVTDPADVLLQGVSFVNGDLIGWEDWNFTLNPGATSSVTWNNVASKIAVAKWGYGTGRSVYLDFHYITSDCSLAISYPWGQKLLYNSVLWAGKVL